MTSEAAIASTCGFGPQHNPTDVETRSLLVLRLLQYSDMRPSILISLFMRDSYFFSDGPLFVPTYYP